MTLIAVGAVLCAVALIMLYRADADYRASRAWCDQAAKADGRVSRIGERGWYSRNPPTSDERGMSVAVVLFKAANGVEYEFDAPDAPKHAGTPVVVAYDPASPSTARLVPQGRRLGCVGLVLAAGIALIAWGIIQL